MARRERKGKGGGPDDKAPPQPGDGPADAGAESMPGAAPGAGDDPFEEVSASDEPEDRTGKPSLIADDPIFPSEAPRAPIGTPDEDEDRAGRPSLIADEPATESHDPAVDLPWLEAVEDEEPRRKRSAGAFWWIGGAAAALLVVAFLYLIGQRQPEAPAPETASAPTLPELPTPSAEQPPRPGASRTRHAAPPTRHVTAAVGGQQIQLASYYSAARTEKYWDMLVKRYPNLAGLRHDVVEGSVRGRTVYRLQASGSSAFAHCDRLRARRVACMQIGH